MQKVGLRHWWEYGDEKIGINKLNEKRSLIPWEYGDDKTGIN